MAIDSSGTAPNVSPRGSKVDVESAKIFQKSWNVYQTVLRNNDLCHQDIMKAIKDDLSNTPANKRRVEVCDLGCGDAWMPNEVFKTENESPEMISFTGVDASLPALKLAKLDLSTEKLRLVESDVMDFLRAPLQQQYDIIMTTFVLHHFSTDVKLEALKCALTHLKDGGVLYYGDVYNAVPGSTREETMRRWKPRVHQYKDLSRDEIEEVWEHIEARDFPEEEEVMRKLLVDAGFHSVSLLFKDDFYACVWRAIK